MDRHGNRTPAVGHSGPDARGRRGLEEIPSGSVSVTFFLFLALFTALLVAELSIMFRQIKIGPKND